MIQEQPRVVIFLVSSSQRILKRETVAVDKVISRER